MRKKQTKSGLTVNVITGSHVVLLGLDLTAAQRKGCLGFAIQREDHTEDERYWMRGMKTFEATDPGLGPGGQVSSREHPFQSFQWADYSAKPDHEYTYTIIPLYGKPMQLKEGEEVRVRVQTEKEFGERHLILFNRGAVSSQEYARRFENKAPDKVGDAAYRWLSRGLIEALLSFIKRAKDSSYGIYGAVYETQWPDALKALKDVEGKGGQVRLVFDAIPKEKGPTARNTRAILDAKIKGLCIERTQGTMMHNKFFVLTKNDRPIAVWTGSTNLTENGIFGQSNCGHVIEDTHIARAYLEYWKVLKGDPENPFIKDWIGRENIAPPNPWDEDETVVFSPRRGLKVLEWYAYIAGGARKALFMTFAFGMHKKFQKVYEQNDDVLRFALMEKEGNGRGLEQAKKDILRIRSLPNVVVAIGNNIVMNSFDRWLKERAKLPTARHVKWIHTKYMLVDPLSEHPIVITGSANFSKASTDTNDENMVVIRNNKRVTDIYLGEFMRLYSHYAFREAVAISQKQGGNKQWQPKHLVPDDSWQVDYFSKGHQRFLRRQYFAGL